MRWMALPTRSETAADMGRRNASATKVWLGRSSRIFATKSKKEAPVELCMISKTVPSSPRNTTVSLMMFSIVSLSFATASDVDFPFPSRSVNAEFK